MIFDLYVDINRQSAHIFGEDPSQYVDEVKQSLAGERGLSPRNRDLVMEVLGRLADRVQSAENSRNAVVNELVSLRERFVVIRISMFRIPQLLYTCHFTEFRGGIVEEMRRITATFHAATTKQ